MNSNIPVGLVPETDPNIIKMFDDLEYKDWHKVHFDGSHYVTSKEGEKKGTKHKRKPKTDWDDIFSAVYELGRSEGVKPFAMFNYIFLQMRDVYCYPVDDPEVKPLRWFIKDRLFNIRQAKKGRARRFKYKSGFVRWNYFITITYSDKLITEQEFYRSLKKQFGNLHTRHGWKIGGAFECGKKTKRLHFHGLVYVPDGELMGELKATKTFDFDEHRMKIIHQNLYFSVRYGRNDFEKIDSSNRALINSKMGYIQKYIQKSGERMFYSRGIPCHVLMKIKSSDISTIINREFFGTIKNYVLYDDVIICDDKQSERCKDST